jgi:hypothetical protein
MKEQKAASPVWRWNVVGLELEVGSPGARFTAVEPDISKWTIYLRCIHHYHC